MYLIIGATGYLGSNFLKNIIENTSNKVIATYNSSKPNSYLDNDRVTWMNLDVSDDKSVDDFCNKTRKLSENFKVVYLSAYHHPDKVEENPRLAWDINVASLDSFLNKFKPNIENLYYSSTDSVYGESINRHVFKENDEYKPENTYGRTKVAAEQVVLMHGFNVARYPFLIGPSIIEKPHFFDKIADTLRSGKVMDMFEDSYRTPISFDLAAYYTIQLFEKCGNLKRFIVNISSDDHMSKYDVALKIAEDFGFDKDLVAPISIKQNNSVFKAKRAESTLIDNSKLKSLLNLKNISLKF